MIRLVQDQENTIKVYVSSSIDTTGFSLTFLGKTVEEIKDGSTYKINISADDVVGESSSVMLASLVVLDGEGNAYQNNLVEIQIVPHDKAYMAIDYNEISITISANWVGLAEDGGGGGDLSKYATKELLAKTSQSDRHYTDDKVSDVIIDALENQTVTVIDEHGDPVERTVKESMQNSEDLKGTVKNLEDTRLQGGTKTEYNDTIYLYTDEMPRKGKFSKRCVAVEK